MILSSNIVNTIFIRIGFFFVGVLLGILLVFLLYYIFVKLLNKHVKKKKTKVDKLSPSSDINEIINNSKTSYLTLSKLPIKDKISKAGTILYEMVKQIASSFYPTSKYPVFETSSSELLSLSRIIVDKLDNAINDILSNNMFKIVWGTFAGVMNVKNAISNFFKKNSKDYIPLNLRKMKIAKVIDLLESYKKDGSKTSAANYRLLINYVDNKVLTIFDEVGDLASKIYSKELLKSSLEGDYNV